MQHSFFEIVLFWSIVMTIELVVIYKIVKITKDSK